MKAGYDGINKVVNQFVTKYPNVSKRQTELKIAEIAIKEKREEDKGKVWHIRPQYAHYLTMDNAEPTGAGPGATGTNEDRKRKSVGADDSTKKRKPSTDSSVTKRKRGEDIQEPKKFKNAFNIFVKKIRAQAEAELKVKLGGAPSVRRHSSVRVCSLFTERRVEIEDLGDVGRGACGGEGRV